MDLTTKKRNNKRQNLINGKDHSSVGSSAQVKANMALLCLGQVKSKAIGERSERRRKIFS